MSDQKDKTFLSPNDMPIRRAPELSGDDNSFPMMNGPQRAAGQLPGRQKIPLEPGHSPMDWSKLKTSQDMRGGASELRRITLSELSEHNKRDDLWMSLQGKVYNVTHYVKFHPGGQEQLMRGAGKDATSLFFSVHPWVNADRILDKCHIGFLVS